MRHLIFLLCVVLGTATYAADNTLRFNYDFSSHWNESNWLGDWYESPGSPKVPVVWARVLLPFGKEIASVEFTAETSSVSKVTVDLPRVPHQRPLCNVKWQEPPSRLFSDGEYFPQSHIGEVQLVRKHMFKIALIPVFPFLYHVSDKSGFQVQRGELLVELKAAAKRERIPVSLSEEDREEALQLADEISALPTYPLPGRFDEATAEYLIVGPKNLVDDQKGDTINRLRFEKAGRGISSEVLTTEDISTQFTGKDLQEKIRNAVKKYYAEKGTRFLLLVGNGYSITPTRILTVNLSEGSIPSDLYFGCLDGDFKTKPYDLACEVAVGRAPVNSVAELKTFVQKSIVLQDISPGSSQIWKTLNFGERLDDSTFASSSLKMLKDGGVAGDITTKGYSSQAEFTTLYDASNKTYKASELIQSLNDSGFYTVNHLGHANSTYCMRYNSSVIPTVKSPFPFIGYTQGCHPGNMRQANWASQMVVQEGGGAGAYMANSNYGWYQPGGSGDGASNRLHVVLYDTIFQEGYRSLGKAFFRAKERLTSQANSNAYMLWVVYETNLFGDPEIVLKYPN